MTYIAPIVFVVLLWWASTVVLLYRCGQPRNTFPGTLVGTALAALLGLYLIWLGRGELTVFSAYASFTGALLIWAFHETSYLLGVITGPRPRACPEGAGIRERFKYGVQASLYHELAIVLTAVLIAAICWRSANQTGLLTFAILWLMRWSVKLNIFLGVRNLHHEFWPSHLQYLQSYARTRAMNAWFPWVLAAAMLVGYFLFAAATGVDAHAAERTSAMLLLTILSLATLEHVLLMLPVPDALLWRIGTRSRESVS